MIGDRPVKARKWRQAWKSGRSRGCRTGRRGRHEAGRCDESENATFGISFCGSGARALSLRKQACWLQRQIWNARSVDEGVAINEGCNVLGFGFMDKEELGERLVQAWQKKYGAWDDERAPPPR
ncbi:hypothetical protein KCP73_09265 [Salmonella enterica subsp. enterica]|nr:hypothetical protein KCP73_09265 [Salmonella enterica subsp. enterica]